MKKENIGSSFDSFLEEEGIKEEVDLLAQKAIISRRITTGLARRNMTQTQLAKAMKTSRTVVHRLLDPKDTSVTLATLAKASKALGVRLLRVAEVDSGLTEPPPRGGSTAHRPIAAPRKSAALPAADFESAASGESVARDPGLSRKGLHKALPGGRSPPPVKVPKSLASAAHSGAANRGKGPGSAIAQEPQPSSRAATARHSKTRSATRVSSRG